MRKFNKLDTSIDVEFTKNLVLPPIFTALLCVKLFDSSIEDIYTRCCMNLVKDPANFPAPQFVDLGLSTNDVLDKGASIWNPYTRVGRPTYAAHWSTLGHIFGKTTAVGNYVIAKSDYNYKTDFDTWRENQEFESQKNARNLPPLDLNPVGAKKSDPKTLTMDSSNYK